MSNEPKIVQKAPYSLNLEMKKYWWCSCGESKNQPFCDGSHKTTPYTPLMFQINEPKQVWLCGCKRTKNQPFCDGTHKNL